MLISTELLKHKRSETGKSDMFPELYISRISDVQMYCTNVPCGVTRSEGGGMLLGPIAP